MLPNKKNLFVCGSTRSELIYGEVYAFFLKKEENPMEGVYLGSINGFGRILVNLKDLEYNWNPPKPSVFSFDLEKTTLEGRLLKGKFSSLFLDAKEKSFAMEILNKKSL